MRLDASPDPTDAETAAIAVAVAGYLDEVAAAAAATARTDRDSWDGEKWRFSGRLDALGGTCERVPTGAPSDEWTAAGRSDRF